MVAAIAKNILVVEYLTVRVNYRASTTPRGLSLDAHAHNVKRNLHVTIERQPDVNTSLFETLPCERLPCFSSCGLEEKFFCEREAHNLHSKAAIKVMLDTGGGVIGHVPDGLAASLAPLLDSGTVTSVTGTTTGPPRSAAEGVWAVRGGIELPCEYALHCTKKDRSHVRTALRRSQSTVKSRKCKRECQDQK